MIQTVCHFGQEDHGTLLTHDEYATAHYEEPWRYERMGGRLIVSAPLRHESQVIRSTVVIQLLAHERRHDDSIEHVFCSSWIVIDDDTDRIADIGVYLKSSSGQIPERIPEIVFEIVSEGGKNQLRDYEEKRVDYERAGVQEYIVVDRFKALATVFRLQAGHYESHTLGPADSYCTSLLPDLEIPLRGIL